ncbi:unnamed protein product [Urochloa decumbens]|uniref:Uncharacterized protein n=1 Tax=Urochloa decumbens TaxID=240449 RepID=A0ABC8YX25_9POAL
MADARMHNPIIEALIDDLAGLLRDADAVQRRLDLVSAAIAENAALLAEAAAQIAQARRRLVAAAAADAGASPRAPSSEELGLLLALDDPEVAARAADYAEAAGRAERIRQRRLLLFGALGFLLMTRALCFASARARLLPGLLLTVAAAYALAYFASCGAVVPGPASLLRISVLLLCFLFGIPVVGNLA